MECKFDKSLLQAFIDDSIEPLELVFLTEHIKFCKQCRDDLEALYSVDQSLKSLFNQDIEYSDRLTTITELTVDNLFMQIEEKKKLKDYINDAARMNNIIVENSSRFLDYIPGVPFLRRKASEKYRDVRQSFLLLGRRKAK